MVESSLAGTPMRGVEQAIAQDRKCVRLTSGSGPMREKSQVA